MPTVETGEIKEKLENNTHDELLKLKQNLANEVVDKLLKKNPNLASEIFKGSVAKFLVDDGSVVDYLYDNIVIKGLGESIGLITINSTLERYRGMFSEVKTKAELESLKTKIFNEIGGLEQASAVTKQSPSTTSSELKVGTDKEKHPHSGNEVSDVKNNESSTAGKTETSIQNTTEVDKSRFAPGDCPFKKIPPYKGIKAYDVRNVKIDPKIGFNQLSLKGTEGSLTTLKVKDEKERFATKTAGYKKNNPCNVSPFKGDVGRNGSSKVADGQNHAKYNSMEDGLASFMRLMRQDRYRNKSIQGINCSGMQGIYKPSEPDSLKALRIIWITNACNHLNVSPFQRLNLDDKETMMAWAQETAIRESGSHFSRETLERAYKKAFG